ncbi:MAG: hypothetical protein AB7L92_06900 [Alphaproteobacteria bacterium]
MKYYARLFFALFIISTTVASTAQAQTWTGSVDDESIIIDSYENDMLPPLVPTPHPWGVESSPVAGFYPEEWGWRYEPGPICKACSAYGEEHFSEMINDPVCCGFGIRIRQGSMPDGFVRGLITGKIKTANRCKIQITHDSTTYHEESGICEVQNVIMEFNTVQEQ